LLRTNLITIAIILLSVAVSSLFIFAGSRHSINLVGWPLFAVCGCLIFMIQWIAFIPSYIFKTEKHFDLTGSLTYISMVVLVLTSLETYETRTLLIGVFVVTWAARLGMFLFIRILSAGHDSRFNKIKHNFWQLLMTWTLQALWILITFGAGLAASTSTKRSEIGVTDFIGILLFLIGFAIEIIADYQKSNFKKYRGNDFINIGLWKYSRHPNYFGEIILWVGIAMLSLKVLSGLQYITLISPVFVILLLTKISGLPMLENKSDVQWGHLSEYQIYKKVTPVLIPNIFKMLNRK